jgi:hypothetical protein
VAVAIVVSTLLTLAGAPAAGSEGVGSIEPRIARRTFDRFLERVRADDDQRVVAEMLYSDYTMSLEDLAAEVDERVEKAGRERVADALAGRIFLDPEELRRLRIAVLRAEYEAWPRARTLAEELILNVESVLGEEAFPDLDAALDAVRCTMYLEPRRARSEDEGYAGDGIDVGRLVEAARRADGELEGLGRDALATILDQYHDELAAYLDANVAAQREGRMRAAVARVERDRPRQRAEERANVQRWQELHRINVAAVDRVAAMAGASLGADAETRWRRRFDEACFPRVYRITRPERQHGWIARRVTDSAVRDAADRIIADFAAADGALAREEVSLMLRGRLSFSVAVHSGGDPAALGDSETRTLYEELLRLSGRRSRLANDAEAALDGLVSERRRKQMHADIAAAAYGRRR